jgi:hypothetical protein
MSTATLRLQYRALSHKMYSTRAIKVNGKLIYFLAMLLSFAMLIFYIFQVNELIRGNFLIKNYTKQSHALAVENRTLEDNFAQSNFLGSVMAKSRGLGFEKTARVTYMRLLESSLAEAR